MSQNLKGKFLSKRGASTVFGSLLFTILILTVASVLFVAFYRFNDNIQQANKIEDTRMQEKIVLSNISISQGIISSVSIKNLGSVTVQIKAFYVNNEFICDPSNYDLNPKGAYIYPQDSVAVRVDPVPFDPLAYITIATSNGIRAIELESNFVNGSDSTSSPPETYYGPLRLNFTLFYYKEIESTGYPIGSWHEGSILPSTVQYCAWNITVTNIDLRNITLSQYSSLTLVTNEGGSQYPWYTNYPGQFIASNQTTSIIYIWKTPLPCLDAQGFQGFNSPTSKVFLTFYGKFSDGSTYGQTIPFEAILRV